MLVHRFRLLRSFAVVWISDEKTLASVWKKAALKLMVYTGTMKLTYDFSSLNFPAGLQEKEINYLIYGCEELDAIIPMQTELNLF